MLNLSISVAQKNADPAMGGAVPPYADIEHKDISYINRRSVNGKGLVMKSPQTISAVSRTVVAITCARSSRV